MDVDHQNIIYELLSTGFYEKEKIKNLHEIKSILRKIHFDVIEWYDKSCYILINTGSSRELILGYNEEENKEILEIFENLCFDRSVQGNILTSLIENNWIELDRNGKPVFSKRSLVIFKDKILNTNGVYKSCRICSFLVYKKDIHDYCNEILAEKSLI
ncbi:hypothetical protein NCER_102304 [Vairimorpha ceranae BRL01]|uniref:Uncharacterized protein n=2 Tax=Vairimorpha ceranae TaxID=40302 RepID=C4VBT0_VAIC1|nr:nucleolar protein [Vairimorpha ceranae]EEQ81321.1 hypothetical protein NCER_102304 [Vairimorpha ceranae BRL01]KAF5140560.1 hypothetical protein G9O61_00g013650 [Vairimorpha ceranae]KKO74579.1 nucleolar protein [Vairimorpha ceranae]